ncbi:MAG: hypothetical protein ACYDEY_12860 [Acidimicrobiales bacterium]
MTTSNRERVGRAFEALAEGLGPFVEHQMRLVRSVEARGLVKQELAL